MPSSEGDCSLGGDVADDDDDDEEEENDKDRDHDASRLKEMPPQNYEPIPRLTISIRGQKKGRGRGKIGELGWGGEVRMG